MWARSYTVQYRYMFTLIFCQKGLQTIFKGSYILSCLQSFGIRARTVLPLLWLVIDLFVSLLFKQGNYSQIYCNNVQTVQI